MQSTFKKKLFSMWLDSLSLTIDIQVSLTTTALVICEAVLNMLEALNFTALNLYRINSFKMVTYRHCNDLETKKRNQNGELYNFSTSHKNVKLRQNVSHVFTRVFTLWNTCYMHTHIWLLPKFMHGTPARI